MPPWVAAATRATFPPAVFFASLLALRSTVPSLSALYAQMGVESPPLVEGAFRAADLATRHPWGAAVAAGLGGGALGAVNAVSPAWVRWPLTALVAVPPGLVAIAVVQAYAWIVGNAP
ncbi:hypothetical protein L6R50_25460 [Myxococcota bacterium]|nr:hypothetical protein [Myxococcota bacterium]